MLSLAVPSRIGTCWLLDMQLGLSMLHIHITYEALQWVFLDWSFDLWTPDVHVAVIYDGAHRMHRVVIQLMNGKMKPVP